MESRIIHMCQKILSDAPGIPIYLMSIPPSDHLAMDKYHEAGVTEVSFIEKTVRIKTFRQRLQLSRMLIM